MRIDRLKQILEKWICISSIFIMVLFIPAFDQAQSAVAGKLPSFLEQANCPLHSVRSNGAVLLLKSVSKRRIANFGVVCLTRQGSKYRVIKNFEVEEPIVEPDDYATVGVGLDSTPLNICRADRGILGISEVVFSDGTRWKSPWNKLPPLAASPGSNELFKPR
jgi:hypothetical protein